MGPPSGSVAQRMPNLERLRRADIPYTIVGGTGLFQHADHDGFKGFDFRIILFVSEHAVELGRKLLGELRRGAGRFLAELGRACVLRRQTGVGRVAGDHDGRGA